MIVLSSPSGGGKSTLCRRLLDQYDDIAYSISCTTRAPRGEEQGGVSYHFMDKKAFEGRIIDGGFLEYAEVHGNLYGTLKETIQNSLACGKSLILDIDVQGAAQIRAKLAGGHDLIAESFLDIFIAPPSLEDLKARLEGRGEDCKETIALRMQNAEKEMRCASDYRYVIENDEIDRAYIELIETLEKESLL
jgi:guanylate kinase